MRFISEDTNKGDVKDPLSLNLYTYCQGNPIRYVDINGHERTETLDMGFGGVDPVSLFYMLVNMLIQASQNQYVQYASQNVGNYTNTAASLKNLAGGNSGNYFDPRDSGKGNNPVKEKMIEISDKKMYQLGKHFSKHGRDMGYGSKDAYDTAARKFVELNQSNPNAKIYEGIWNGSGTLNGTIQRIIYFDGKSAIIDRMTGQIIDFYGGCDWGGLIKIVEVTLE